MSEEFVVDLDDEIEDLPSDLYLVEVDCVEFKHSAKGDPYIVITMHVCEGPYEGAGFQQWIGRSENLSYNIKKLNQKTLKSFISACLNGEPFEGPLRFVDSPDGKQKVAEEFAGMQLGAYLGTKNDNITLERGGFVPASAVEDGDSDESPFG